MKANLKKDIWKEARNLLNERMRVLQKDLASIQESANQETKSSAGDKYETGRAMAQQEIEQLTRRLAETEAMRGQLLQIDPSETHDKVRKGSIVQTSDALYFISVPLGRIVIGTATCFCISPASPIGAIFMAAKTGDTRTWQGKELKIEVW